MTKFIDITTAFTPKKEVKKTVFTHYLNSAGLWNKIPADLHVEQYANVLYLGAHLYNDNQVALFKAWDNAFGNATIFLGTKGDEKYQPFYQK